MDGHIILLSIFLPKFPTRHRSPSPSKIIRFILILVNQSTILAFLPTGAAHSKATAHVARVVGDHGFVDGVAEVVGVRRVLVVVVLLGGASYLVVILQRISIIIITNLLKRPII